jgi:hypothetical protein
MKLTDKMRQVRKANDPSERDHCPEAFTMYFGICLVYLSDTHCLVIPSEEVLRP